MALAGFGGDLFTPPYSDHDRGLHLAPQPGCPHCVSARARNSDPATSHEAARRMTETGTAARDRDLALGLIRTYPGSTAPELGRRAAQFDREGRDAEWHRQRIGRRLSELQRAGLIERGAPRNGCSVWYPRQR